MTQIAQKFETLLANPRLSQRDKVFAQSLYDYYKENRRLSTGRRKCLSDLEAKVQEALNHTPDTQHQARLEEALKRVEGNQWASGFVQSLLDQMNYGKTMSARQEECLQKIEKENSDEVLNRQKEFEMQFTPEMATRLKVIADYYHRNPPYYRALVDSVRADESFVPTEKQWKSMVENKYAQQVWENYSQEAKFPVGSTVQFRRNTRVPFCHRDKVGFVISAGDEAPTSPAKGGKRYKILPIGGAAAVDCEERDLKKYRSKK